MTIPALRIAILADIHGNLPALEAVTADLLIQGVDAVYLAGDQISRVPWHNEVMDLIADKGWPAIYGNHDLIIGRLETDVNADPFTDRSRFAALYWTQQTLHARHLASVRTLPATLRLAWPSLPPIRLWHGTPGDPFSGIFSFTSTQVAEELLHGVDENYVVLGHTHRPIDRTFHRRRVFNGGSVGLPYNGDTRAQYLILDGAPQGWTPTFRAVAYDHAPLRPCFEASGMLAATGATGELHVRTALTAEPWSSDFAFWLHHQPGWQARPVDDAVAAYLASHGPGNWAFAGEGQ